VIIIILLLIFIISQEYYCLLNNSVQKGHKMLMVATSGNHVWIVGELRTLFTIKQTWNQEMFL